MSVRFASLIACSTPSAIPSSCVNTASICGCACKRFCITSSDFSVEKSPLCEAIISIPSALSIASLNPEPRCSVTELGGPEISTTFPFPFNFSTKYLPAFTPIPSLSPFTTTVAASFSSSRSTIIKGIPASLIFCPTGESAADSIGSMTITSTPCAIKSSTSFACLFGSAAFVITYSMPSLSFSAFACFSALSISAPIHPCVAEGKEIPIFRVSSSFPFTEFVLSLHSRQTKDCY